MSSGVKLVCVLIDNALHAIVISRRFRIDFQREINGCPVDTTQMFDDVLEDLFELANRPNGIKSKAAIE